MMCAHRAGIPVFVTGGIGGVHRGGEDSESLGAGQRSDCKFMCSS